ncbi:MAG TPA: ATP-binding cassette domain-containing protein, partial [Reyranella sp.]|nr:ATP-binding cassette domain-containing protein [Reyranella sp.]
KTGCLVGVHDASVFVDKGEILVLMGLSGSGKSSLLRCVNGLNKVTRGKVIVNDGKREVDVASCDAETLRQVRRNNISMVFQQFGLMPWLTVHENVGFGLDVRGMGKAERDKVVDEKIALVRLDKFADKFPHELSGGMQQRVGLARAFATEADILLMDEPFSALDPLIREHLQDELMELQRRLHKTIIFVSHDLDEALKIGSRIAIMEAGRVVQFGRPEDIILNPVNDYVRQFVASMNPLTVLKGGTLMRPASDLAREPGSSMIQLDRAGKCRCRLDPQGKPVDLIVNGKPGQFLPYATDLVLDRLGDNVMVCGTPVTPMRAAVMVRQQTKRPLVLIGDSGELIGVVGEHELYRGMLRQTEYARVNQPAPATVETP